MLYPLPALAAFMFTRNSRVTPGMRAGTTAVAAVTPGVLGIVPAVVAATASGRVTDGGRQTTRHSPLRFRTPAPPAPPAPDTTPTYVQVPNLEGRLFDDAEAQLRALKLVAARADVIVADQDPGVVLEQRTRPGRYVPQGAEIDLVVSKAAPADDEPTEAEEMAEMKTIEGKVDRLKADVDAKLGHVEKSLNNLADKIAAQNRGGGAGGDTNAIGVKPKV